MPFTIQVQISPSVGRKLEKEKYKLCVARSVNGTFDVIWKARSVLSLNNNIECQDLFRIFAAKEFNGGDYVDQISNSALVQEGQKATYLQQGNWGPVSGEAKYGQPIRVSNQCGDLTLGLAVFDGWSYETIYVSEAPVKAKSMLGPMRSFLFWFEKDAEAGTMFADAKSNTMLLNFPEGVDKMTIGYAASLDEDPANGIWSLGGVPVIGRTYEAGSFRIESDFAPSPAQITALSQGILQAEIESVNGNF